MAFPSSPGAADRFGLRCRQLQLQHALSQQGPIHLLGYRFVVEKLGLTPEQQQLKPAFEKSRSRAVPDRLSESVEERAQAQRTIDAVLTPEQKVRWQELFGEVRILHEFAQLELPPLNGADRALLSLPYIRELKLTEPQIKAIQERRSGPSRQASFEQFQELRSGIRSDRLPDASYLSEILTAEQLRRYRAWSVQRSSAFSGRLTGPPLRPMSLLRYRPLVEGLGLSPDQLEQLKSLYQDWMGRHWSMHLDAEERAKSQLAIDAILSAEQKARWRELLGEPLPDGGLGGTGTSTIYDLGITGLPNSYFVLRGEPVVEDLQLTPAQIAAIETRRRGALSRDLTDAALAEILTPEQLRRFRQIELQVARQLGPLQVLRFRCVVETLDLTPEQVTQLTSAYREFRQGRWLDTASFSMSPPASEEEREKSQRLIDAVLSAEQRTRWQDLFGERRSVRDFGQAELLVNADSYLLVSRDLQLTSAQVQALQPLRAAAQNARSTGAAAQNAPSTEDAALSEVLTAEQMRRYRQIQLQQGIAQQGPLSVFRYRFVVDSLGLTEEQAAQLKSAYQDFMSHYWSPSVRVAAIDREKCQRKIDAILSAEQKTRWQELLGEPGGRFRGRSGQVKIPASPEPTRQDPEPASSVDKPAPAIP